MQPTKPQLAPFCHINQDLQPQELIWWWRLFAVYLAFVLLKILEDFPLLAKLIHGPDSLLREGTFGVSVGALSVLHSKGFPFLSEEGVQQAL